MNRRSMLAVLLGAAGGLVLPWEPRRVYSFGGGRVVVPQMSPEIVFSANRWEPGPTNTYQHLRVFFDGVELREVPLEVPVIVYRHEDLATGRRTLETTESEATRIFGREWMDAHAFRTWITVNGRRSPETIMVVL